MFDKIKELFKKKPTKKVINGYQPKEGDKSAKPPKLSEKEDMMVQLALLQYEVVILNLTTQLAEAQARNAELHKALFRANEWLISNPPPDVQPLIDAALSRPTDYSALNEALAQECERLADKLANDDEEEAVIQHRDYIAWLREEAAAHRGKK